MSYQQRKKNRKRREKREIRYKIIIASIMTLLFVLLISSLVSKDTKTIMPEKDIFLEELEIKAVVIKDEKVFKLLNDSKNSISQLEGERVPIGIEVGDSVLIKDLENLKEELEQVKITIKYLEEHEQIEIFENNKDNLIKRHNNALENLQQEIYYENYRNLATFKKDIILLSEEIINLLPQDKLVGYNLADLKAKEDKIIKEINSRDRSKTTAFSGILTLDIDGYENIFKPEDLEDYNYDDLNISEEKNNYENNIKNPDEQESFKIINNLQWYLALKIEDRKDIDDYNIGDKLYIKIPKDDEEELELEGKVISVNNTSKESVIILEFDKYLHDFYNDRFLEVKLIQNKKDTLKIPNYTIIENQDEKGVYIKDFSGIVKFRPIKILKTSEDYTYIDKGNKDLLISIETRKEDIRTISVYDELIVKPQKFKEGQILD